MELRDGDAEVLRLSANLVQGDEAVVHVEGLILHAFSHHGPCVLLEPVGESDGTSVPAGPQNDIFDEIKNLRIAIALHFRFSHRDIEVFPVSPGDASRTYVGSVHGKMCYYLRKRPAEGFQAE